MPAVKDEFDIGPLSWVKPEIELALQRADEGITRFSVNPGDQDLARATLSHLHQVSGALLMVGLEPVARISEAIEKLVDGLGRGDIKIGPEITGAMRGAIASLSQYLEGLMRGEPNRPLVLFPAYRAVLTAAKADRVSEVDLFYPDLSRRPKFSDGAATRAGAELATLLTLKRAEYQRGLLNLLRGNEVPQSLRTMRGALATIEAMQPAGTRMLWWIAVGFLEGLANSATLPDVSHKQLSGRIDLQIKRQAEGADTVSERLMRELLFSIAKMLPVTERVREIQDTYRLANLLPPANKENPQDTRVRLLVRDIKDQLEVIKESWLKYTSGNQAGLTSFVEQVTKLNTLAQSFGNPALKSIFTKLAEVGNTLKAHPREPGEALALETATTLLMAKDALENYHQLGPEFKSLAETAVVRVAAALKGQPMPHEGTTQLAEVSRAAQEKMLFFQLGQEIITNLNHIEQVLDAFFRDPAKRSELASVPGYINQVQGAFSMLESDDAVNLLKASRELVQKFSTGEGPADPNDAELTAEAFSNLGLFVSAIQQGRDNPDQLLLPVLARFHIAPSRPVIPPEPEEIAPARAVEQDLEAQKHNIATLFERWQQGNEEHGQRSALTEALSAIRQDAQLASDAALADHATRALALVVDPSGQPPSVVREAFVALLGRGLLPEPQSAKPVGVIEPAAAEIDAELLEIFLEEATEVLESIATHHDVSAANPTNRETLTVIRRGFHTLKGSGRMVGLTELGEVAWQVEQVMNKWLRDEKPATKGLLHLINDFHHAFSGWIETLKAGGQPVVAAAGIFRLADQLKNDIEPPDEEIPVAEIPIARQVAEIPTPAPFAPVLPELSLESAPSAVAPPPREPVPAAPRKVQIGDVSLDPEFFEIFANEARTHRATLLNELSAVCDGKPVSNEFMRAAHTLAGICRTSGFMSIAELGFGLEQWLLEPLDHHTPQAAGDIVLTKEVVETLSNMVNEVLEQRPPVAAPALVQRLDARLYRVRIERREQEAKSAQAAAAEAAAVQAAMEATAAKAVMPVEHTIQPPEAPVHQPEAPVVERVAPPPRAEVTHASAPLFSAVTKPLEAPVSAPIETGKDRRVMSDDIDEQLLPIFLEEALELIPEVGDTLRIWRGAPTDKAPATLLGRQLHTLKGSARMAGVMRLGELAHILETQVIAMQVSALPAAADFDELVDGFDRFTGALERLKSGERTLFPVAAQSVEQGAELAQAVEADDAQPKAAQAPITLQTLPTEEVERRAVLRVRADLVDRFVNDAGEISIARSRIEGEMNAFRQGLSELVENVSRLRGQLREIEIQAESQIQSSIEAKQEIGAFDPLEFDRFTRMQELTRFMAESVNDFITLQQSLTKNLDETDAALAAQARLNRDLQQELMGVRMVPVGNLADRLYRVVRQTAKELGKKANLELKGMRTELDRGVLEKIVAPFEHLLRNAIAHGIEIPQHREAAGKSAIGEITIDARQQANEIQLTFTDDGAGVDVESVREKAIESGLMAANEDVPESQLIQYIFTSGFSTASEITQISGRGVGLDVVREAIVTLGGRVEVDTQRGQGTRFTINLPLTLAVTQAVLIHNNGTLYAIPSVMVEQVQEWKLKEIEQLRQKKEIVWQGNHYPFHSLGQLLGEEDRVSEPRRYYPVMLLRSGVQRVAIEIDEIEGNREIVVKSIGPQISRLSGITGATVLGNGQVVLILNPVLLSGREEGPVVVRAETKVAEAARQPLVMVVDDSLTVRKITSRLLNREGYQVITAKDGVDALQQLQEFIPDVMLLDIEMPRMDGFELTRNIRSDAKTAGIPIIMITSRTAEKHRNHAFSLGVNEYLGKPYQEEELLGQVARFLKQPATTH